MLEEKNTSELLKIMNKSFPFIGLQTRNYILNIRRLLARKKKDTLDTIKTVKEKIKKRKK